MRNATIVLILIGLLVIVAAAAFAQVSDPGVLLRAAIEKEEVDGDLNAAIAQYKQILASAGNNRSVAARALLRLGGCYEKLGRAEARNAYQKLIANYPEQHQEVSAAHARLTALRGVRAEPLARPTFRPVRMSARLASPGSLSPDGRTLAFTDDGSVWVVPVRGRVEPNATGIPVRLTEPLGARGEVAWSGDGSWLAFNTRDGIYRIRSTGGEARKLPLDLQRQHPYQFRLSLSRDGSRLAYSSGPSLAESSVYVVPAEGGAPRTISSAEGACMPVFSPDGTRLAFVTQRADGQGPHGGLWVVREGRSTPVLVSSMQGWPQGPVWSPDGAMIAFLHAASPPQQARNDLVILRVSPDGAALREATRFELTFHTANLLAGWTSDHKIGLSAWNEAQEAIYTVPASGGRAAQVSPTGWAAHPRWSPDGKRIFLRWDRGKIASVPAQGGPIVEVPLDSSEMGFEAVPGGGNAISPDGKTIAFSRGSPKDGKWVTNICTVPVQGGQPKQITHNTDPDTRFPSWSPDGKSVAFIARDSSAPARERQAQGILSFQIYSVSVEGGEPRMLTTPADKVSWSTVAWSPDGKHLAYFSTEKTLNVLAATGRGSRVLVHLEKTRKETFPALGDLAQLEMAWSPDGQSLAYAFGGRIWRVGLGGEEPFEIRTGLTDIRPTKLDWSRDGKTIAFTGYRGGDFELHLMEDFLPLVKHVPERLTR